MTQNYELIVKGIRNFENKVTVTLALRDKKRFDGEIFDLDISLDRVEGAALEFYEAAARRSIRQVFLDVAAGLCEGDEQSPEKRPVILEAQDVLITYRGKLPGIITGYRVNGARRCPLIVASPVRWWKKQDDVLPRKPCYVMCLICDLSRIIVVAIKQRIDD